MTTDQCPSTLGKIDIEAVAQEDKPVPSGERVWRSLDEYSATPNFREFVEREFPKGASELLEQSRRTFVKLMGASLAVAGAAALPGCRRPDHKILTYSSDVPEEVIVGQPLYYATSVPVTGGGALGLLVETHEGRPTKIEGNPLHPVSRGKADASTLASILAMYDPDRLKYPVFHHAEQSRHVEATWDDFRKWAESNFTAVHEADRGAGLVIVSDDIDSPTRRFVRAKLMDKFPQATWAFHNAAADRNAIEGSAIAFNEPMHELISADKAKVIVSFDRVLIDRESESVANARGVSAKRRPMKSTDAMSRIYCFESSFSTLGGIADHRLALSPQQISAMVVLLARTLMDMRTARDGQVIADALAAVDVPDASAFEQIPTESNGTFIQELAKDLMAEGHRGHSLLVAGPTQPPAIHALVHAMNDMLGNVGTTVRYAKRQSAGATDLAGVADKIRAGSVKTLICLNTNPVYDAPASLVFAELFASVPSTITLSVGQSETAAASTWSLNAAHWLESWGDSESLDGTISPTQPMIAPLYEPAMSDIEFVAMLAGEAQTDGYEIVRAAWTQQLRMRSGDERFEKAWRRALHDGVLAGASRDAARTDINGGGVSQAIGQLKLAAAPTATSLAVSFHVGNLGDGRDANNAWLQELPDPITKVVWDNPALVSPNTAKALGLSAYADNPSEVYTKGQEPQARMARITIGERSMDVPVWVCPGMADNTVSLALGYGRTHAGLVGNQVGFDVGAVRPGFGFAATGATLERVKGSHSISSTQNHWSLESRTAVARSLDHQIYAEHAGKAEKAGYAKVKDPFVASTVAKKGKLHLGEQLGELAHTPASISAYNNPQNASKGNAQAGSAFSKGPQWGMVIDMAACTGCNACTIACQSENNIPVVGKDEVAKGREMQWIRVDRYFVGDDMNAPTKMMNQPMACVHCENAPCETVCPVNATVHDDEGLNVIAYNRCIGTRYCMNNCPYKVRRFNFFDWGQSKYNGGLDPRFATEDLADELTPKLQENKQSFNQNFIPPRLRAKLDEITKMQMNPDVTIRPRGVIEKCTYCIQRINRARYETKLQDLKNIPDGFFQVACQQACPSEAIVFGDILDETSKVYEQRHNQRGYLLLQYLNTRPRTTHLIHVTNPNPEIVDIAARVPEALKHGESDGGDGDGHAGLFRNDPAKRVEDPGYALSLNILGAHA